MQPAQKPTLSRTGGLSSLRMQTEALQTLGLENAVVAAPTNAGTGAFSRSPNGRLVGMSNTYPALAPQSPQEP